MIRDRFTQLVTGRARTRTLVLRAPDQSVNTAKVHHDFTKSRAISDFSGSFCLQEEMVPKFCKSYLDTITISRALFKAVI